MCQRVQAVVVNCQMILNSLYVKAASKEDAHVEVEEDLTLVEAVATIKVSLVALVVTGVENLGRVALSLVRKDQAVREKLQSNNERN